MTQRKSFLPYLQQFHRGIVWTLIGSIGSQGLVILYHIFYRAYVGPVKHGTMGCLLSLVYLCIAVTNIGLDKTLAPFLETFSESRKRFTLFTQIFLVPQLIFLGMLCIFFYTKFSSALISVPFFSSLADVLTPSLLLYLLLTFILESMRKTLKTFLQLSFYFRFAALVELLGMSTNLLCILFLYTRGSLTLLSSWQVMAAVSLLQLIVLSIGMFGLYYSLPTEEATALPLGKLFLRFSKTRLFSWALQCLNQLYSGNFLVPMCALQFGIESASLMKVITSISYWITLIGKKVFGVTSNALLAHLKSRSSETQKDAFHYLTNVFNQALYGILIFLIINGRKIALLQYDGTQGISWSLLYFMLALTFFESFFILYERWYILEEDTLIYLIFNVTSIGILYLAVQSLQSPIAILTTIICIRVLTFILLSIFSFYRWHIWPSLQPRLRTILSALAVSGICYLML